MRASPLFRLTALWALLVFAFGWGGDALVLHPCPHHSAIAQVGAAHAGHGGAHHAAAQESHDEGGAPAHAGGCSCAVACAGTAFALDASRAEIRVAAPVVRGGAIEAARPGTALPGRAHFVLPYPTAPPVLPS
ncbi:MAG: hypothetical protein ACJ8GN_16185 [Longimicrobiaceae bacterium]